MHHHLKRAFATCTLLTAACQIEETGQVQKGEESSTLGGSEMNNTWDAIRLMCLLDDLQLLLLPVFARTTVISKQSLPEGLERAPACV